MIQYHETVNNFVLDAEPSWLTASKIRLYDRWNINHADMWDITDG